jgi:short-subunit dehydrogenase
MRLDGKVVLITGASAGIGAACTHVFRRRGAELVLTGRSEEKLRQLAPAKSIHLAGDLMSEAFRRTLISSAVERFGRIDVLVNNAGVGLYAPAHRAPDDLVRTMFELNLFAPMDLIRRAVPHMRDGAIVNVGSIAGKMTLPWFTMYSASKYALGALSDGLRIELRQLGIRVMQFCPGYVKTGFQQHVLYGRPPELTGWQRHWAVTPEACAEAIASGLERDARTVLLPRSGWLMVAAHRIFPGLVDRQLEKVYLRSAAAHAISDMADPGGGRGPGSSRSSR